METLQSLGIALGLASLAGLNLYLTVFVTGLANPSPEPFSSSSLTVSEALAVLGGLALIKTAPALALVVFSVLLLCIAYFGPKLFRAVKVNAWLFWKKLTSPAADLLENALPK